MRSIHVSLRLGAVAIMVATPWRAAVGQRVGGVERTACVAATGPDTGAAAQARPEFARGRVLSDTTHPTVSLFAAVQASEVRFAREPKICVSLRGDAHLDSVRVVGRRNLTSPVVRNTTYRDVYVAVEILGHLNAECISARITGAAPSGRAAEACASGSARTSGSAGRASGGSPP